MNPKRLGAYRAHAEGPGTPRLTPLAIIELLDHIDELHAENDRLIRELADRAPAAARCRCTVTPTTTTNGGPTGE